MTFDDGKLEIYRTVNAADPGEKPRMELRYQSSHAFGYETVGISRYYTALQAKEKIRIEGASFRCAMVQHVLDENGLKITRLSLERLGER